MLRWDAPADLVADGTIRELVDAQVSAIGELVDLASAGADVHSRARLTDAQLTNIHRRFGAGDIR